MQIQSLFARDIFRPINGVVKADQLDESSVWQELDEFVVTREMHRIFRDFFTAYCAAIDNPNNADVAGRTGVWVSGFFGSGKSHFLKVLSYLLRNAEHAHDGETRRAVDFFDGKIDDALLLADIKRAVASNTDAVLFNIESKANHNDGRQALLAVFLKVLNERQGYCGDYPHIAHMERFLDGRGKLAEFKAAFLKASGVEWDGNRDAWQFYRDAVIHALVDVLSMTRESAEKWADGAESSFALTAENFCKWVKDYVDRRGKNHRLIFLVDEVGQFIGNDSHLMLSLQTVTEEIGTLCKGRVWVVVTSQEDIDAVLGDAHRVKSNDFSKIAARFRTRLSLSSANVDEVIQSRLLAKVPGVEPDLRAIFDAKGDILRHQLSFSQCGMTFKAYKDSEDFALNYPFAPYQFQLLQKIFESIRRAGATGSHLSRGERSILDAFQSAAQKVALQGTDTLVPLHLFYPSIESFLDTAVKRTIEQAADNASLEQPFDIQLLQVLFLVRYVQEVKGTVENLVTLCMSEIDGDRLALRRRIEESLLRLEKETLISRNGDLYIFLTNEERDISREIKGTDLVAGEETRLLATLLFADVFKEKKKYHHLANGMEFTFNRFCDQQAYGNRADGALQLSVITPLNDAYDSFGQEKCVLESGQDGGCILVKLGNDDVLGREARAYAQTEKFLRHRNDAALPESTRAVLRGLGDENRQRRERLVRILAEMVSQAEYYAASQPLRLSATGPQTALDEAMKYLVENTFAKMGYVGHPSKEPLRELQAILRTGSIGEQTMSADAQPGNRQAVEEVHDYITLSAAASRKVVLQEMIDRRFCLRPYGWPEEELLLIVARLMVCGEITLMMDGAVIPPGKAYDALTNAAKRRRITVLKRQTADPAALQDARALGRELFHEMGPDGEDALFAFLEGKLRAWQTDLDGFRPLAETGHYPGREEIARGLALTRKLLAHADSRAFMEQFNARKADLLALAKDHEDLSHFYRHQKPLWEKLRRGSERLGLNRLQLEQDPGAGRALRRMREILDAPAPYGLIKEVDGLLETAEAVNTVLVAQRRHEALSRIAELTAPLEKDLAAVPADEALRKACLDPLRNLERRVGNEESLAHLAQAEQEAAAAFDAAQQRIQEALPPGSGTAPDTAQKPAVKRSRTVHPARLMTGPFIESRQDADAFVQKLRQELEQALDNGERVQIR